MKMLARDLDWEDEDWKLGYGSGRGMWRIDWIGGCGLAAAVFGAVDWATDEGPAVGCFVGGCLSDGVAWLCGFDGVGSGLDLVGGVPATV